MKISENNKQQVEALQELLQKTYDAEAGYKQVMTKAEKEPLKNWLQEKAVRRSQFANELDAHIREFNAEPVAKGTTLGSAHRTWIDVKSALSFNTDEAILEECVRGEEATISEYNEQISNTNFAPEVRSLLENQKQMITSDLRTVKSLEEVVS
ncbi:PA2169 family four-helix-bundle protein [uncultured Dokdonia sp.]|uniref:ferritin-like domain-containing protein n=1 Tax=uncultured Dokdonia sp. TaxID=575653 RepID=UPI0026076E01|nr:PA2169 family four-helix-bundle protein [uncultured Dokdonia sp.]